MLIYSDKKVSQHLINNCFVKIVKIRDSIKLTITNEKDPYERVQEGLSHRLLNRSLTTT